MDKQYPNKPTDALFEDAVKTIATREDLAYYLKVAWKSVMQTDITVNQLGILWAHVAFEIGFGDEMYNWNFGNIKKHDNLKYTSYACTEIIKGKVQKFEPYHPQTLFAAWDSAEGGAAYLIAFLTKPRYTKALEQLKAENIVGYVQELKNGGYFTDDLYHYTKEVVSLNEVFRKNKDAYWKYEPTEREAVTVKVPASNIPEVMPTPNPEVDLVNPTIPPLPPLPAIQQAGITDKATQWLNSSSDEEKLSIFEKILKFLTMLLNFLGPKK